MNTARAPRAARGSCTSIESPSCTTFIPSIFHVKVLATATVSPPAPSAGMYRFVLQGPKPRVWVPTDYQPSRRSSCVLSSPPLSTTVVSKADMNAQGRRFKMLSRRSRAPTELILNSVQSIIINMSCYKFEYQLVVSDALFYM